jgi:hypothetical protein
MNGMRTTDGNRLLHMFKSPAETDEWLMDETAARGTLTVVAQELDDVVETMYGSLDYAVRLATGVPKKLHSESPETAGATVELRVARPCRVVCGIPVDAPEGLFACMVLAMGLAESIDASMELLRTNLSMRMCRTERDLEKIVAHARRFRADAIVVVMPTLVDMEIPQLFERLESVARSLNAAVIAVESFATDSFEELASLPLE